MTAWGVAWYRRALAVLPSWLRATSGADMLRAFDDGQRHARIEGGALGLFRFWLRESAGLVRTAWQARRPDLWTRSTSPASPHDRTLRPRPTMDSLRTDLRFAVRTFKRRPGLAALAVLTLSLGIGSSTALFSVIDSVLLRPLDFPEPDQVHAVYPAWPELVDHPTLGDLALRGTWSWPELWLVAERQDVFDHFAGYQPAQVTLDAGEGRPERIGIGVASWQLFPMLGADTRIGRLFTADDGLDSGAAALLTHEAWRDRYGSDPDIVERTIRLNDRTYPIVGVLAEGFEVNGVTAQMWLVRAGASTDDGVANHGSTRALGRLAEGVTRERARATVERILRTLPPEHGAHGATVEPFQAELTREVRPVLVAMLAASGLLLLVACGNVSALLLGAGIDRERELAVRGAVGAGRGRIAQQLLTENTLLALGAGVGGVILASLAARALTYLAPPGVPRLSEVSIDASVLAFAVGLAVTCGVTFGLIPAVSLSSTDLAGAMGTVRTGTRRTRLQGMVVAAELAMATLLVVGGLLLIRTVGALDRVDPGFDHERLITMSLALPYGRFDSGDDAADERALRAYEQEIVDAVEALPGVEGVAWVSSPPFFGWRGNNYLVPEGWQDPDNPPIAERRLVSAGYLSFMGIPLIEGRDLQPSDYDEGAEPVVVVSRGFAELAWPGRSAVGSLVRTGSEARVVGVAGDIRDEQLQTRTELAYYAPLTGTGAPLVIRSAGDPTTLIPAIRDGVWSVDPDLPITRIEATTSSMSNQVSAQRYRARLMAVFAALAALFALLGIHGVTSQSVARRTREMGLRVALGADRARVHGMVTLEAVRISALGVGGGLLLAQGVGGALDGFLWGVTRTDPLTIVGVALGLPLLAAVASLPPARRATRVDPLETLKAE